MITRQSLSGILITAAASLFAVVLFILIFSRSPWEAVRYFFTGPFKNRYLFGNMINSSVPLIFAGLGISVAFRASLFNLGGEGQIYTGAVAAAAVALFGPKVPGGYGILLSLLTAGTAAGLLSMLSGVLRVKWNVDSMISSFLISGAVVHVVDYLITGPMDDPSSSLLSTSAVGAEYFLSYIFLPSKLNTSLLFALLFTAGTGFLVYSTKWGYEMRITGANRGFAGYGGVDVSRYITTPLFISGFLHGLGGGFAVLGTYHMAIKGFTSGIGWSAIAAALLAGNNPYAVVPAALFLAYLKAGASAAMQYSDVTMEISLAVQAVVYFLITSKVVYSLAVRKKRSEV